MSTNNGVRVDGFTATPPSQETSVIITELASSCFIPGKSVKVGGVEYKRYEEAPTDVNPAHAVHNSKVGLGPNFRNPYEHNDHYTKS